MTDLPEMADLAQRYRPVAMVRCWDDFRIAFRVRCDELRVARATLDEVGGLPAGQTAKLLAPVREQEMGPISFSKLLAVLGLAVIVVEDADAIERIRRRLLYRNETYVRQHAHGKNAHGKSRSKKRVSAIKGDKEWGRIMNARRNLTMNRYQRKRAASKAAKVRWRKPKIVEVKNGRER